MICPDFYLEVIGVVVGSKKSGKSGIKLPLKNFTKMIDKTSKQ